jgi:hypothetical protein
MKLNILAVYAKPSYTFSLTKEATLNLNISANSKSQLGRLIKSSDKFFLARPV